MKIPESVLLDLRCYVGIKTKNLITHELVETTEELINNHPVISSGAWLSNKRIKYDLSFKCKDCGSIIKIKASFQPGTREDLVSQYWDIRCSNLDMIEITCSEFVIKKLIT